MQNKLDIRAKRVIDEAGCRKEKGITLVALVVTIIVLLILAGVSLSLVGGSNGILTRTTKAVERWN